MEFGFDPLGKTEVDPNQEPAGPAEKESRTRTLVTNQQLQDSIDQERINRKQGEVSQAEELTAHTPHGAVDVHRHTLSKGVAQSVALAWRSSEMGSTVRYPTQLFNGGRVFAKRAPGGSIILDCSGSMSWHTQHIVDAQKIMPNLYVAGYSYHGSNGYWGAAHGVKSPDTYIARYCVLAAKGALDPDGMAHLHDEWQHTGGNSGADPAALWYASRAGVKPIVWVSDGMVSFGEHQKFYKQCDAIMRQHKIVRVLTIEDAIDYLMGKAVPGWHQSATMDTHWVRLGQPYMGNSMDPAWTESEAMRWTRLRANSKRH